MKKRLTHLREAVRESLFLAVALTFVTIFPVMIVYMVLPGTLNLFGWVLCSGADPRVFAVADVHHPAPGETVVNYRNYCFTEESGLTPIRWYQIGAVWAALAYVLAFTVAVVQRYSSKREKWRKAEWERTRPQRIADWKEEGRRRLEEKRVFENVGQYRTSGTSPGVEIR